MGGTNPVATAEAFCVCWKEQITALCHRDLLDLREKKIHNRGDGKIRDRLEDSQREWADGFDSKEICFSDCA